MISNAPRLALRSWRTEDAAQTLDLLLATYATVWRPALSPDTRAGFNPRARFADYVLAEGWDFLIAETAGRIVGMAHWRGDFIEALHVRPEFQGRRVGTALLGAAEEDVRKAGYSSIQAEADSFNTTACAFYQARGFVERDRHADTEWQSGFVSILYEKTI